MIRNPLLLTCLLLLAFSSSAQQSDTSGYTPLQEVVVKAFETNSELKNIPAAVGLINQSVLERFSSASIVQAVNTIPGIRMEERSPGSYRINIRGSSLRSPFGVRNVKVYFNDIPITDPGGHTYLNQLGYYNFRSMEIIKGPGSSLYGAGTGGVLIIQPMEEHPQPGAFAEVAGGSYGLQNLYGSITVGKEQATSRVGFQHQQSNGYRANSYLNRNVLTGTGVYRLGESSVLKATFLYGNLYYQTPGALTKREYDSMPSMARPGNAFFPGAEAAHASISQQQFIAGASLVQQLLPNLSNTTTLYGMFTDLRNPTIQNYGRSSEPHFGGRTAFNYRRQREQTVLNIIAGAELQQGLTSVSIHKNAGGVTDTLRTYDEISNKQSLLFTQVSLEQNGWIATAGLSLNLLKIIFQRFNPGTSGIQERSFSNQLAPRVVLMKKLEGVNVYAGVSKGFSPPTTAELLPTGGAINLDLNAEQGVNYDAGVKGTIANKLYFDVNAFVFSLNNTIVQRRTAGGGDYFANAGKTQQRGIETFVSYPLLQQTAWLAKSTAWCSYTLHNFKYSDFKQVDKDYSGNWLPGVPQHVLSTGWDLTTKQGIIATASYYYNSKIPLNDANSEYADAYHLVSLKAGIERRIRDKYRIKLFAGVDNLLNQKYSLGNDINGFGGRYYNAAAARNYYAALVLQYAAKQNQ